MFVAMNRITCQPEYVERFEQLFATRAGQVDTMPGFQSFHLLRPIKASGPYIVMTFWDKKEDFESWMHSSQFTAGHSRGFADVDSARKAGTTPPMVSNMELYEKMAG